MLSVFKYIHVKETILILAIQSIGSQTELVKMNYCWHWWRMSRILNVSRIHWDAVLIAFVNGVGWQWHWLAIMVLVECLSSCSNWMSTNKCWITSMNVSFGFDVADSPRKLTELDMKAGVAGCSNKGCWASLLRWRSSEIRLRCHSLCSRSHNSQLRTFVSVGMMCSVLNCESTLSSK